MSQAAIETEDLTKQFGHFTAVDHISLQVPQGSVLGLIGPNGAGKTTLIRLLCGLLQPTGGHARVLGYNPVQHSLSLRSQIGYMSQRFSLYDDLTVEENLLFYGRLYGLAGHELQQRKSQLLDWSELEGSRNTLAAELPVGWRQRLAFACATMHSPQLVFLDEPTSGVDPISRRRFWSMIYDLAQSGTTLVVTTHALEEAEYCDLLALVNGGKLVAFGAPLELRKGSASLSAVFTELVAKDN